MNCRRRALCVSPRSTRSSGLRTRVDGDARRSGSPVALDDPAADRRLGARRKLRSVRPGPIDVQIGDLGGQPGVAHPNRVAPGARAQPQVVAAVLARDIVEDGGPLEPDPDLGPLDAVAGLVGDRAPAPRPRGDRRYRGERSRAGTPARTAAGSSAPFATATAHSGARREQKSTQSPGVLGIAERRRDARRDRPAAGIGPRPSHQMQPSGRSTQRTSRASMTAADGDGRRRAPARCAGSQAAPRAIAAERSTSAMPARFVFSPPLLSV